MLSKPRMSISWLRVDTSPATAPGLAPLPAPDSPLATAAFVAATKPNTANAGRTNLSRKERGFIISPVPSQIPESFTEYVNTLTARLRLRTRDIAVKGQIRHRIPHCGQFIDR